MQNLYRFKLPKSARNWLRDSPFANSAFDLGVDLSARGYSPRTVTSYISCIAHFAHWSSESGISVSQVSRSTVAKFLDTHLSDCTCAPKCRLSTIEVRAALGRWLLFTQRLRQENTTTTDCSVHVIAELQVFADYLSQVRGLQQATIDSRSRLVKRFLNDQFGASEILVSRLLPTDVLDYLRRSTPEWKPASISVLNGALRSYFRFKELHGTQTSELIASLPGVAQWRQSTLPKALAQDEVQVLLDAFDQTKPGGQRDYAIARCYVDLGLRSAEVARLELGDIDWKQGIVHVRGKGRRVDSLPLPHETGRAISHYIQHRLATSETRRLFLRLRPPYDADVNADTIRGSIRNAAYRCGLSSRLTGPHRLRHTLATRLVEAGSSIKEISDLLRHRDLNTTAIYAKVDLQALALVASPWPESQS